MGLFRCGREMERNREGGQGLKFLFGGLSCMAAACVTNPIDVIKTRLQIQGELSAQTMFDSSRKYKGSFRGGLYIIQQEGLVGLYKGIGPSLIREAVYSTIRVGGYDLIKSFLSSPQDAEFPFWKKVCAGLTSGAIGAAISTPTDVVKVRMQANETHHKRYRGTLDAFGQIYRQEGFQGLFKGTVPNTQRAALLTASQLATYDHAKHGVINVFFKDQATQPGWHEPVWVHLCASIIAGFVCSVVTSPVDLVKTRLMNQPFDHQGKGTVYSSSGDCFLKTIRSEGVFGIYKGFFPNWFRIGPHTI